MAAPAANRRLEPANLLLGDLDRIEAPAGDLERERAELAEREPYAVEQVPVLLREEASADIAAGFLVGENGEDHIARQRRPLALRPHEGRHEHRDRPFHVDGAASPDVAVEKLAAERWPRPALVRGRDDVDVPLQQQRRPVAALDPRDEVGAVRDLGVERRLDPGVLQ